MINESFETADLGQAESFARRVYSRVELREPTGEFRYEQFARGSDGVNFTRFKISSQTDIEVDFDGVAAWGLLLGGHYDAYSNGQAVDTAQPWVFTPGTGGSHSDGFDLLMVNIDVPVLARRAAERLGIESASLEFRGTAAISPALRSHWLRTINYAWNSVVRRSEVFANDAIRITTFDAVVASALATFPIGIAGSRRMPDGAGSAAIRRATQFIEDNADRPITVAQVAEAARLSVRGLQNGFRREVETTPLAYLRQVRLEAARADLIRADAGSELVANIARRWAFAHLGRFAAQYHARFGESPIDTLRG